jgi:hypothetical protein
MDDKSALYSLPTGTSTVDVTGVKHNGVEPLKTTGRQALQA